MTTTIPPWNSSAVLPPIRPGQPGESADRSPYHVNLAEVVRRFALSPERIRLLRGLIAYRQELARIGMRQGFQWLNGSFTEHKEETEGKPPRDIDVVTFYSLPDGRNQRDLIAANEVLFNREEIHKTFFVDALYQQLGGPLIPIDVRQIAYYYSLWSHRRNGVWKGFLEVKLSVEEDQSAATLLDHLEREGGRP